jgi:hypothetical protein
MVGKAILFAFSVVILALSMHKWGIGHGRRCPLYLFRDLHMVATRLCSTGTILRIRSTVDRNSWVNCALGSGVWRGPGSGAMVQAVPGLGNHDSKIGLYLTGAVS